MKPAEIVADLVLFAGVACLTVAGWWISPVLGLVVCGFALVFVAVAWSIGREPS